MGRKKIQTRQVVTSYYNGSKIVKINRAAYSRSAVLRCVDHMQENSYGATHVEVFDEISGTLYAVVKRSVGAQTISILYKHQDLEACL